MTNKSIFLRINTTVLYILMCAFNQSFAAEWSSIFKKINTKYEKFEQEIKDMVITQETVTSTPEGRINSEVNSIRKGDMFRVDTLIQVPNVSEETGGVETIVIYNGKDAWMILSLVEVIKLEDVKAMQHQMNLNWWKFIPENAKIAGIEIIDNRECYIIDIEGDSKYPFARIWLDKDNLYLIKGVSKGIEGRTMRFVHSDFKKLDGNWEIPCKTEMYIDNKLVSIAIVKSVEINRGISDEIFDPSNVELRGLKLEKNKY